MHIGGYAQIDYNHKFSSDQKYNGKLDVHRLVLLFNYDFHSKLKFVTEIELEHVVEVYVEQAYLNYQIKPALQLRAGLVLIPMGIINEFHEPPTFNGVERPNLDKYIVPSTWREIGIGFNGRFDDISLSYQAYLVNGFNSYNGAGKLNGSSGLRGGRQKAAESIINSPNFTAQLNYYGLKNLKLGLAGYYGKTQSTLNNGLDKNDDALVAAADSSVVGVAMAGINAQYTTKGLSIKGQANYSNISNTAEYNEFTGNDLGSAMFGYYAEVGYDVLHKSDKTKYKLTPFVRFEQYNTHLSTDGGLPTNSAYLRTEITTGISWEIFEGASLKLDYQFLRTNKSDSSIGQLNAGVAVWFK